jgi:hypothetical protein
LDGEFLGFAAAWVIVNLYSRLSINAIVSSLSRLRERAGVREIGSIFHRKKLVMCMYPSLYPSPYPLPQAGEGK